MEKLKESRLKDKGFFSIDALFAIIMLILTISTLVNLYQGRSQMVNETRERLEGKMISEKLAGAIDKVADCGKPLTLKVDLPENILGEKYEVQFDSSNREISVQFTDSNQKVKFTEASVVVEDVILEKPLDLSQEVRVYWTDDNKIGVGDL